MEIRNTIYISNKHKFETFRLSFLSLLTDLFDILHFCLSIMHLVQLSTYPYSNATLCSLLGNRFFSISVSSYVCLAQQ